MIGAGRGNKRTRETCSYRVEALAGHERPRFDVAPLRGDYDIYGPAGGGPRLPLGGAPSGKGRGVYAWTTVFGDVVVGPTFESVDERTTDVCYVVVRGVVGV